MDTFWDPLGEKIDSDTFIVEQQSLINKIQKYKDNPRHIKKYLIAWISLPIVVIVCMLVLSVFIWGLDHFLDELNINLVVLSVLPLIFFYGSMQQLQKEFILYLLCQENQWVFNSIKDDNRLSGLKEYFPQIFLRGHDQFISNQLWGSISTDKKVDFWRGTFEFTEGYGKSSHSHTQAIFILRIEKNVPTPFSLKVKDIVSTGNQIKTESEEFNQIYNIVTEEKDAVGKMNIIKTLSPSIQVRLIDFINQFHILDSIHFQGSCIIIVFGEEVWRPSYTNFLKKVTIDERDKILFDSKLRSMIEIPTEMTKFMD